MTLHNARLMDMDELRAFLGSSEALIFRSQSQVKTYAWVERTLRDYGYLKRPRGEKGLLRRYLQKITGYSPAQLTRLISQFCRTTQVRVRPYQRHRFATKFTVGDRLLLAEVDQAHERLSGPATKAILKREYEFFGQGEYQRLSQISVAHLYNLRQSDTYRNHTTTFAKTKATQAQFGERRRPDPQGRPGYLRVDTVHQGDRNGVKGVYHINTVDAVTQWEVVGCCGRISERYLVPVLQALLIQYPFVIQGFHSDNGSEFVNKVVAKLLNKLLVEFTKSRPRKTNDQALVECKNGAIIRKQMGYMHIPQSEADKIQHFYTETLNVYLNFHRPCGFATETMDTKGKIKKQYDNYLTPFAKLQSLSKYEHFLRPEVTHADLEQIAKAHSDTQYAKLMQQRKSVLFRSFPVFR